jgi:hypothetical protein
MAESEFDRGHIAGGIKHCNGCGVTKPFADFSRDNRHSPELVSGYQARCKACYAAWIKVHRRASPEASRRAARKWTLRNRYGVSVHEYDEMVMAQCGTCAICGEFDSGRDGESKRLAIHHDHETGRVVALLCTSCNWGMGQLGDDPASLRRAAELMEEARAGA